MNGLEAAFLGLVQGLTEFLPISSSGHLVLLQAWLGLEKHDIVFEVFVHFGTFLAVILAFWTEVREMLVEFFRWLSHPLQFARFYRERRGFRLLVLILVGSVPAGILGILFESTFESFFSRPLLVSYMLLVTGVILFATRWASTRHEETTLADSLLMGTAQAFAIIPGISRSGSTISTGMFFGLNKNEAARFSFLLSLPAIFGATLLKTKELAEHPVSGAQGLHLFIGTAVAFVSGYFAIKLLLDVVRRGKFSYFALYCFAIGIAGILFFS